MFERIKSEIIKYGKRASLMGLTPGISGNISYRKRGKILITSSGSANGFLKDKEFSVIDFDGNVLSGNKKPSTERYLHINFYESRSDINCVFHTHSPYLTAFASAGLEPDEYVSPEIIYCFNKFPIAGYATPGSVELVEKTSSFFKDYDVVLMENHGVVVGGKTVKDAYLKLELAEAYAKSVLFTKFIGGAKKLSHSEVEKIRSLNKEK